MGTLAGSNVLLLTLPWAVSIWLGKWDNGLIQFIPFRCDLGPNGKAKVRFFYFFYTGKSKMYTKFSWTKTGVTVYDDVQMIARLMIVTLLPYTAIQVDFKSFVIISKVIIHYTSIPTSAVSRSREMVGSLQALLFVVYCLLHTVSIRFWM